MGAITVDKRTRRLVRLIGAASIGLALSTGHGVAAADPAAPDSSGAGAGASSDAGPTASKGPRLARRADAAASPSASSRPKPAAKSWKKKPTGASATPTGSPDTSSEAASDAADDTGTIGPGTAEIDVTESGEASGDVEVTPVDELLVTDRGDGTHHGSSTAGTSSSLPAVHQDRPPTGECHPVRAWNPLRPRETRHRANPRQDSPPNPTLWPR